MPRGGQQTPVCHGIGGLYTELRGAWLEGKLSARRGQFGLLSRISVSTLILRGRVIYEWDDGKEAINRAKHGIGFAAVAEFDWDSAVLEVDERYDYAEERVRAFGLIGKRPYCLVFTPRGPNIRIISLRPMHTKEARRYGIQAE